MKKLIITLMLMTIISVTANAQSICKAERHQRARIRMGVRTGELTKKETGQLVKQQTHIKHDLRIARADGRITKFERRHIRKEQILASRNIYGKRHNNRVRI